MNVNYIPAFFFYTFASALLIIYKKYPFALSAVQVCRANGTKKEGNLAIQVFILI